MPQSVPQHLAKLIGNLPFVSYTTSDKIPGCDKGNYFPVPNCPLHIATERLNGMRAITTHLQSPPMTSNSIAMAELCPVLPARNSVAIKEATALAIQNPTAAAVGNIVLLQSNDDFMKQLQVLKSERNELQKRLNICKERLETSGVSSVNMLKSKWHDTHPQAAHHFFGDMGPLRELVPFVFRRVRRSRTVRFKQANLYRQEILFVRSMFDS
jgi:hypothetical protein